jgi:hypothetical protein
LAEKAGVRDATHQAFRRTSSTHMQNHTTVKDMQRHLRHTDPQNTLKALREGYPSSNALKVLTSEVGLRQIEVSGYAQDTWRATDKLTLTYGLRYELFTPRVEVANREANFDPNVPGSAAVIASPNAPCGRALRCTDFKDATRRAP